MANVLTMTTPLMRQTVGFDRFNDLFESLRQDKADAFDNYPPYNIEKLGSDDYRVVMAVAGFSESDLDIVLENGELTVTGKVHPSEASDADITQTQFLHRGIATRAFKRTFRLADHIEVVEAAIKDGLLTINLKHEVPEEKKPRTIRILDASKLIGGKKGKK